MHRRLVAAALAAIVSSFAVQAACAASNDLPLIDHVVVVVLENHSFDQIVDPHRAPFIHHLATDGALFVNAFAVSHPSQPNYFALFSGSTQGISDNEDHTFDEPTLASALNGAGKSFVGYVETGSPRRHNPWESFVNARATERNFSEFPRDFTRLPTISFGAHVRPGEYAEYISHYSVLSTLLALYGLTPFAEAATTPPIVTIWKK